MLNGKCVVLGITGSIAAYKAAVLTSALVKEHCKVHIIMTKNAQQFITPVTFETLTGTKCVTDTFDRNFSYEVEHVSLAKKADLIVIAPASANIIGKLNSGIADDMLTTTVLARRCPIVLAPAMNTYMYNNEIVQSNIKSLKEKGFEFISPESGRLACGDTGTGKMAEPKTILEYILMKTACKKDLKGKKILVTAGATQESIDPVRFITNHSSGKMGFALSKAALYRGADVTLIYADVTEEIPEFCSCIKVSSAEDMYNKVMEYAPNMDCIFMAAAVSDYTPSEVSPEKVKKNEGDMYISLKRTKDILKTLGENKKDGQILCGFSMETENMLENSRKKLVSKNADIIAANNLKQEGAGFGTDTNVITIITKDNVCELPIMSKFEAANKLIDAAFCL